MAKEETQSSDSTLTMIVEGEGEKLDSMNLLIQLETPDAEVKERERKAAVEERT